MDDRAPEQGRYGTKLPPGVWAIGGFALLIGLLIGLALGVALNDREDQGNATRAEGEIPEACLSALDAARSELEERDEALQIPERLTGLVDRATTALTTFDTAELESVLEDFEALSMEAQAASEGFGDDTFADLATECESATPV